MVRRTLVHATYDDYLSFEYPESSANLAPARAADIEDRLLRLTSFPHTLVLQLAYPELDYLNRWCWQQFGPAHGECLQQQGSEYPACDLRPRHAHEGKWLTYWLAKTDYDFGFNEWSFAQPGDRDRFLEFIPQVNWGEHYPK